MEIVLIGMKAALAIILLMVGFLSVFAVFVGALVVLCSLCLFIDRKVKNWGEEVK